MDAEETIAAVEDATATERSRLGSDKALIAATGANLEPDAVWAVVATREAGVAEALESWAGDAEGQVAAAVERAGTAAADRRDRVDATAGETDALSAHLREVSETRERVGAGLVAVPLVLDRLYLQVVNFFINEADERSADVVRDLRSSASDMGPAREALAALDEGERERAREAAVDAVGVAYDEYAEALEAMGLDPKPVC